ncbi:MAG: YfhO family protein [Deltaproteobacteria bacterium]|nr:YfhO family protein [Deltaproteobacteria bacterium]
MSEGARRFPRVGAFGLIAAGAAAFWWFRIIRPAWDHPFVPGFGNADFFMQIYPMSFRAAAWIRDGVFPLWNPYQFAGHPFLAATLYGVCYPPNLLYLFLPTAVAIEAVVVLHLALAGWFTYRYAAEIGLAPVACFGAAAVYMFCGFMASLINWFPPAVASSTWLPLALIGIERIVVSGRPSHAALLAAPIAFTLLGGWTQFWLYTTYVVVLYAGLRIGARAWAGAPRGELVRMVALLGLGLGLGLAAAAVQLLPARELQMLGPRRTGGLTLQQLTPFLSLSPQGLFDETLAWSTTKPFIGPFYLGPIVVTLIATSLVATGPRVPRAVFWIVLVAGWLISLGPHTPFFEHVYLHLPGARLFREPRRIAFLVAFSAALLAAFGLDALSGDRPARRVPKLVSGWGLLAVGAILSWRRSSLGTADLIFVVGAGCATGAAVFVSDARRRRAFVILAAGFAVADLVHGSTNVFRHPFHGVEILHRQDRIFEYIRANQGLGRTYLHDPIGFDYSVTEKQGTLREIYSITDYEPLSLVRFEGLFDSVTRTPRVMPFTGFVDVDPGSPRRKVLDVLSLRYWVEHKASGGHGALGAPRSPWRLVPEAAGRDYLLYEHAAPLPRAYVATDVVYVADAAASLAAVLAPTFDPRSTVIVERAPEPVASVPAGAGATPVVPARVVRYEPREVEIEADVGAPGYLVLTDTHYPGWRAAVDGIPAPIYAANHVVRAVPVGAGRHVVTFRYEPTSVRLGMLISFVAWCAVGTLVVADRGGWISRAGRFAPPRALR